MIPLNIYQWCYFSSLKLHYLLRLSLFCNSGLVLFSCKSGTSPKKPQTDLTQAGFHSSLLYGCVACVGRAKSRQGRPAHWRCQLSDVPGRKRVDFGGVSVQSSIKNVSWAKEPTRTPPNSRPCEATTARYDELSVFNSVLAGQSEPSWRVRANSSLISAPKPACVDLVWENTAVLALSDALTPKICSRLSGDVTKRSPDVLRC